ncbi:aromatic-ring-hydroxylating dioxygenase subunit beta [Rhodococcus sp. IEGM 1354]|uniref:aromatic-ring-hydroxylating dioxygenase subunit beta n=1 Tax=Rhodococcus sp. IEGM 1354 TaxID=3047088 RepID=UPI0024B86819|nr:aromatic-ring-hydroxylating dioxygenase subunit beta [Rhodococcus sp. IEGM 1354]MDI9933703.1 aromatic-ring-hydroxylating dioxygenase subunit beta [Rhodococcus sp. IEGM 1354]
MTMSQLSAISEVTRQDVEDLLFEEAELLDDWKLDQWLTMYTDDARYVVPPTDDRDADASSSLMLIDDNRMRMGARVDRLNSRKAHREYPHSNLRHLVSNVRLDSPDRDELSVKASFAVYRSRAGRDMCYFGRYRYLLVIIDGRLLIRSKRVELDMTTLRSTGDVGVIL